MKIKQQAVPFNYSEKNPTVMAVKKIETNSVALHAVNTGTIGRPALFGARYNILRYYYVHLLHPTPNIL